MIGLASMFNQGKDNLFGVFLHFFSPANELYQTRYGHNHVGIPGWSQVC